MNKELQRTRVKNNGDKDNQKLFWVRIERKDKIRNIFNIKYKEGKLLLNENDVIEGWKEYFTEAELVNKIGSFFFCLLILLL